MSRAVDADFQREVGIALLSWIVATRAGRWRGPRGTLDYAEVNDQAPDGLVRDFVAWASGYADDLAPGSRERMEGLADELLAAGWGSVAGALLDRGATETATGAAA